MERIYIYSEVELIFEAPELKWYVEIKKSFYPQEGTGSSGLNYAFNYPFNYAADKKGIAQWNVDHIISNEFMMIIYGPCENPRILINGYPYEVFVTLERNEYLIIDSAETSVKKYASNGIISNEFDNRGYEYSIFEPIPSGLITFNWSGDFGFDVTLYCARREAKW